MNTTNRIIKATGLLSVILLSTLHISPLSAQQLNHYHNATKTEKSSATKEKETPSSTQKPNKNRSTQQPNKKSSQYSSNSPLTNYHKKTKAKKQVYYPQKRHRRYFHRTPRRHRHYVPSFRRHRYNYHNYYDFNTHYYDYPYNEPNTIVIVENHASYTPSNNSSTENSPLSTEQLSYLNSQLDIYESRESLFKITTGVGSAIGGSSGIHNVNLATHFTAPPSYGHLGRGINTWGIGYIYKGLEDDESTLHSHRLYIEGITATLYKEFTNTWRARIGTNILKSTDDGETETSSGLLFGIQYELHNLNSIYAFNVRYDGILYNIGSSEYESEWESNITSYFRIYLSKFHIDIGGEANIIDLEDNNYFHQIFTRVGIRF